MEFSRQILIKFNWWNNNLPNKPINDYDLIERLESEAEDRIRQMRNEGYTSGELFCEVDGIQYNGWWNYNYV